MFTGYLAMGGQALNDEQFEIINNGRAMAYIDNWNMIVRSGLADPNGVHAHKECITWLTGIDACPGLGQIISESEGYQSPAADPAPWFDPMVPDTARFLGIVGIDVQGAEDSTREARVEQALGGGGAIGRMRYAPRELLVRAVAVAVDDCGMEVGLNWLRCQYQTEIVPCQGDALWFFDCCPDCARIKTTEPPANSCWATTYDEILNAPVGCPEGTWWPTTFDELTNGPPTVGKEEDWCRWIISYYELTIGLPRFSCNLADCVMPYVRQFHSARITQGPTVLTRRQMSAGVMCEIEFTIVCADPHEYSPQQTMAALSTGDGTGVPWTDPEPLPGPTNPFLPERLARHKEPLPALPTEWTRYTVPVTIDVESNQSFPHVPSFVLHGAGDVAHARVSLVRDGEIFAGLSVPAVPDGAFIEVVGADRAVWTDWNGERNRGNGYVRGFDGGVMRWPDQITKGDYELVVDVQEGSTGTLVVEALAATVGCA